MYPYGDLLSRHQAPSHLKTKPQSPQLRFVLCQAKTWLRLGAWRHRAADANVDAAAAADAAKALAKGVGLDPTETPDGTGSTAQAEHAAAEEAEAAPVAAEETVVATEARRGKFVVVRKEGAHVIRDDRAESWYVQYANIIGSQHSIFSSVKIGISPHHLHINEKYKTIIKF